MTVLDTFRNPPVETMVDAFGNIIPLSIQNQTGSPSNCGVTDVEGNIAYFNNLCVQTINGGPALPATASQISASIGETTNQAVPGGDVWTQRTWLSQTVGWTPVNQYFSVSQQGILINQPGLYLVEYGISISGVTYTGVFTSGLFQNGTPFGANVMPTVNGKSAGGTVMEVISVSAPGYIVNCGLQVDTGVQWGAASLTVIYYAAP